MPSIASPCCGLTTFAGQPRQVVTSDQNDESLACGAAFSACIRMRFRSATPSTSHAQSSHQIPW